MQTDFIIGYPLIILNDLLNKSKISRPIANHFIKLNFYSINIKAFLPRRHRSIIFFFSKTLIFLYIL